MAQLVTPDFNPGRGGNPMDHAHPTSIGMTQLVTPDFNPGTLANVCKLIIHLIAILSSWFTQWLDLCGLNRYKKIDPLFQSKHMKLSLLNLNLNSLLLYILLAMVFSSCEEEEPKEKIDYLKLYNEPNYPKKATGRFLKIIEYQYPALPTESDFPFEDGIKVEFFYNSKNYVDYFKVYGFQADTVRRVVRIEYNISGLVSRIKYFDQDSTITGFELFEYNAQWKLTRISKYERTEDQMAYELASFSKFTYPAADKIEELRYGKYNKFIEPFRDVYSYDEKGNIKEVLNYAYDTPTPYSSWEYYYNDKKSPFENLGLPVYEIEYDHFERSEVFSKNHTIGYQAYTYENSSVKVPFGEKQMFEMVYDSLDFPVSRNDSIFYNYVDLE